MNSLEAANDLLTKVRDVDKVINGAMEDAAALDNVVSVLVEGFNYITLEYPELVEDVIARIVRFHTCEDSGNIRKITDFVHLPQWYGWELKSHDDKSWWDKEGKYYGLRMSEVINMYLIAEQMNIS